MADSVTCRAAVTATTKLLHLQAILSVPLALMRRSTRLTTSEGPTGDQEDESVNLAQKIAVSKEMTGLLERRLKELHEIGSFVIIWRCVGPFVKVDVGCAGLIRQQGLDLDQKKDSNRCYADLEAERQRMAAEQLANELRPSRMRFNAGADGKGHASAVQSARNDGPDGDGGNDGHAALVNHLNPFRRMSGLVGLRPEEDAALIKKLHDLKRELQKIEVACAGRLIDSVVFAVDAPPPFPLDVRVVLKYVGYKISVPYDPKYFRYYLLHPCKSLACTVCCAVTLNSSACSLSSVHLYRQRSVLVHSLPHVPAKFNILAGGTCHVCIRKVRVSFQQSGEESVAVLSGSYP
jgi:hypothetical protein